MSMSATPASPPAPITTFLSLGAGIQSTAILLMSIDGHLPPLEHAIFADTGWEPADVYTHLGRLEPVMAAAGIQLHRVSVGNIRSDALDPEHRFASMPLFVQGEPWTCPECDGSGSVLDPAWKLGDDPDDELMECPRCHGAGGSDGKGMVRRQCTSEYKLKPIKEQARRLLGAPSRTDDNGRVRVGRVPGRPGDRYAINWVGISTDEIGRQRPSDVRYLVRVDPLIDVLDVSRADCIAYLQDRWPHPVPRSACIGCPFHSNLEWRTMRDERPAEWADAVDFDHAIRKGNASRGLTKGTELLGEAFLHADRVPLADANIDRLGRAEKAALQGALFGGAQHGCNPFDCHPAAGGAG